jgi:hypothetical protein
MHILGHIEGPTSDILRVVKGLRPYEDPGPDCAKCQSGPFLWSQASIERYIASRSCKCSTFMLCGLKELRCGRHQHRLLDGLDGVL